MSDIKLINDDKDPVEGILCECSHEESQLAHQFHIPTTHRSSAYNTTSKPILDENMIICKCCNQAVPKKLADISLHSALPHPKSREYSPNTTLQENSLTKKSDIGLTDRLISVLNTTSTSAPKKSNLGLADSTLYQTLIDKMSHEIPQFPKAVSMYVHSGNIINWNRLKRKPNHTPTDELCETIKKSLEDYLHDTDKTELQYMTELYRVNNDNIYTFENTEDRQDIKVTVKVFVCTEQSPSFIAEAVSKVLNELNTDFVETLLLAVSPVSADDDDTEQEVTLERLKPYWLAMEELVSSDKVLSLGVCDLNKETLQDLYTWAQVKPTVNQVNLESCCVMPKDLVDYAKQVNLQLLSHNDSPVFLTKEILQNTIHQVSTERDSDAWVPQWIVRYSGIVKGRGIIKMKGYIFHGTRDNRKRML